MTIAEETLARLTETLDRVSHEFTHAAHIDDVFWQVQAIIADNPRINRSDAFQDWLGDTYVDSITVRLRRITDRDAHALSLWRLLEHLKPDASQFTRAWFVARNQCPIPRLPHKWFDNLAGPGQSALSRDRVSEQQQHLQRALAVVKRYANSSVAHISVDPSVQKTTFEDVRRSLIGSFRVFKWCALLLTGRSWSSPVPAVQTNWTTVFREPWLDEGRPLPGYKHLDELAKEAE